ncbi:hypothetical protein [Sphingomonas phage Birtae]|nr:hypothetical protein [Sphingomonas phage Birtae]
MLEAADTAKTKIDATLFGQAALIIFILAMIAGAGLLIYKFFEDRREKSAA